MQEPGISTVLLNAAPTLICVIAGSIITFVGQRYHYKSQERDKNKHILLEKYVELMILIVPTTT